MRDYNDDYMSVIIPRNVTIPVKRHQIYYTSWENQNEAEIQVYQGESRTASRNHCLGKFKVSGIPDGPAGEEVIDVTFSYDQNGLLQVSAVITSTGEEACVHIDMMESGVEEKIDVSKWKDSSYADDYRSILRRSEKFLKKAKSGPKNEEMIDRVRELKDLVYQLKKAILEENLEEADYLEEDIQDLIEEVGE